MNLPALLGVIPDTQIARMAGRSRSAIVRLRQRLRIKAVQRAGRPSALDPLILAMLVEQVAPVTTGQISKHLGADARCVRRRLAVLESRGQAIDVSDRARTRLWVAA